MQMILASTNRGKYREMKAQLEPLGIELLFGGDFEKPLEVDETGEGYAENALLKARAWAEATGLPALADDSGLEAEALGGIPGIHSARIIAGSDRDRMYWLLGEMKDKEDRRGRFACAIAVVFPDKKEPLTVTKYCPGHITREPAGESGFGYDPIFVPDGFDRTFAELGDEIKNKISHRAMAVKGIAEKLIPVVQSYAVRGM
ncbi:RdgB/HAM1 family non-canonical purine NTP pyrophosphatase [Cloacibacillus porcorum]|uniref:RdgB/HAM1 family non-canonical purine NTP pyrophosphatase n=1 Tax=Cloacibacillus porcorum TaxID=1197717 RepID=UPI001459A620|nr:RdgB/HAM1 family non-canonical purine NTP pyrophosphatase [Cloacibacillus porcorum]MCC8183272.1 RdgB/HAM1 family non-canonical purine NTP pyrophosphatase [Cloacibacillus porcorum]MDY5389501.1 RdgB/HAM1 family non-canonical purine NTP pyrophosphatase [Cloacibacillus porcorum]NMF18987.1 RdgB/HAM1 family non-canonical purine NTP pyrophosphatase [Cloacibacillus porcorum]